MPTYQYRCTKCGYEFEEFQSITDSPITFCPKCKGKTERLISGGAGILFKGNGFYITDYRSEKYKADAKKDSSSASIDSASKSSGTSGSTDKTKKSTTDNK